MFCFLFIGGRLVPSHEDSILFGMYLSGDWETKEKTGSISEQGGGGRVGADFMF
jgi:hypothetical protein